MVQRFYSTPWQYKDTLSDNELFRTLNHFKSVTQIFKEGIPNLLFDVKDKSLLYT